MSNELLLIYPVYNYPRKSPPLGLAYLAAFAERSGFSPTVVDLNVAPQSESALADLLTSRPWLLVGLSFMTSQFVAARGLAQIIKRILPQTPLVAGGPHPSSIPERTLGEIPELDLVVRGEGEETLVELASALRDQRGLEKIPGLVRRLDGGIVDNGPRDLIGDLDQLPFPAWKHFDLRQYNVFSISAAGESPVFALLSSRGCPNPCTFCDSHTIFRRKFRPRSAQNIFDEVMYLHQTYGMIQFDFVDDLITLQKKRVIEFSDMVRQSGIPFRWMANARVNTVDREMLEAMKAAGCIRVDFGVETGDLEVRRRMRKNITDDQIISAHRLARDVGLSTGSFVMVGNLGETRTSAAQTVRLLQEIGDDVMVAITCPFPGTELYQEAKAKGLILTEDWSRYVTSPTYTEGYQPVMRTEELGPDEILDAFYYIHSFFARRKFQRRFGRFFYLNPRFYREWVLAREGLGRRFRMAFRLISARLKGPARS